MLKETWLNGILVCLLPSPVSYTHLAVYKRQLEYSSNTYMVQIAIKLLGQQYVPGMALSTDNMDKAMTTLRDTYADFGMGCLLYTSTKRTRVLLRKVAPLGDPLEISLRGYELTLRKSEAQMISVVMLDEGEEK